MRFLSQKKMKRFLHQKKMRRFLPQKKMMPFLPHTKMKRFLPQTKMKPFLPERIKKGKVEPVMGAAGGKEPQASGVLCDAGSTRHEYKDRHTPGQEGSRGRHGIPLGARTSVTNRCSRFKTHPPCLKNSTSPPQKHALPQCLLQCLAAKTPSRTPQTASGGCFPATCILGRGF